jgi:hypothetical protein
MDDLYGGGGGGGGGGKAASSSASSASAINFGSGQLIGADGGLNPLAAIALLAISLVAFGFVLVIARR